MKIKLQKPISSISIIVLAGVHLLAACQTQKVPEFNTMDLLITESDMPNGWKNREEPSDVTDVYVIEASAVTFIASTEGPDNIATIKVSKYDEPKIAANIFKKQYYPSLSDPIPEEWLPLAISADQYSLMCFKRPEPSLPDCHWGAQYDEYIVEFITIMIPGFMSMDELEKVITTIDSRMVTYLE